jgi:Na+-driven multidrug efflux pump
MAFDYLQSGYSGVIKAIGKGTEGLYAFVFSYYAIGLPLSIYLAITLDY